MRTTGAGAWPIRGNSASPQVSDLRSARSRETVGSSPGAGAGVWPIRENGGLPRAGSRHSARSRSRASAGSPGVRTGASSVGGEGSSLQARGRCSARSCGSAGSTGTGVRPGRGDGASAQAGDRRSAQRRTAAGSPGSGAGGIRSARRRSWLTRVVRVAIGVQLRDRFASDGRRSGGKRRQSSWVGSSECSCTVVPAEGTSRVGAPPFSSAVPVSFFGTAGDGRDRLCGSGFDVAFAAVDAVLPSDLALVADSVLTAAPAVSLPRAVVRTPASTAAPESTRNDLGYTTTRRHGGGDGDRTALLRGGGADASRCGRSAALSAAVRCGQCACGETDAGGVVCRNRAGVHGLRVRDRDGTGGAHGGRHRRGAESARSW